MEFVSKISAKIILIDGTDLANLMIQYDVGVRLVRSIQVKRLDLDYFEGEDS
jgi:restriction system protein